MPEQLPAGYRNLLNDLTARIRSAQYEALKAVNYRQLELYWYIGRQILARQESESWGKSVVERLSKDLQHEFPGLRGLSSSNLWRMRSWVFTYQGKENLAPMVREIGWSHNIVIMEKCKDGQRAAAGKMEKSIALSQTTGKRYQLDTTT